MSLSPLLQYKDPSGFENPKGLAEGCWMAESFPVPPVSTFVVRFWQEWSAAGPRWHGRIEHVQSGECVAFLSPDGMLDFIRSFGAMPDDASQPTKKDGAGGGGRSWADHRHRLTQANNKQWRSPGLEGGRQRGPTPWLGPSDSVFRSYPNG